jgi:hypothetical protein
MTPQRCPFCRTFFSLEDAIKLHIDRPPEHTGEIVEDHQVDFIRRIILALVADTTMEGAIDVIEEADTWLTTQPPDSVSSRQTSRAPLTQHGRVTLYENQLLHSASTVFSSYVVLQASDELRNQQLEQLSQQLQDRAINVTELSQKHEEEWGEYVVESL